jgi:hypothetical protein
MMPPPFFNFGQHHGISEMTCEDGVNLPLTFKEDRYKYLIFYINLNDLTHKIVDEYDVRADVENLVGEAKRE